jgi:hypothetical protein
MIWDRLTWIGSYLISKITDGRTELVIIIFIIPDLLGFMSYLHYKFGKFS